LMIRFYARQQTMRASRGALLNVCDAIRRSRLTVLELLLCELSSLLEEAVHGEWVCAVCVCLVETRVWMEEARMRRGTWREIDSLTAVGRAVGCNRGAGGVRRAGRWRSPTVVETDGINRRQCHKRGLDAREEEGGPCIR
jgi:hypothetical protein